MFRNQQRSVSGWQNIGFKYGIAALLISGLLLSVGFNCWSPRGLTDCSAALLTLERVKPDTRGFEEISKTDLKSGLIDGSIICVDARIPADYAQGHIPGAINFPVDATLGELETCLTSLREEVSKGDASQRRIVVYCQSSVCDWDSRVAQTIKRICRNKILLFTPGWVNWDER